MTKRHASLFSGIGGFDLAAERAGIQTVMCAEQDSHCQDVLRAHWPDVPIVDDVRSVDGSINADIISGGFPCQDISVAGRRAGLAGERSGLWWEFHRILAAVRPTWAVIENVFGLLSSNRGRDMGAILGALGQLGYGFAYRVFDAQYVGVAQRRRRVFIVGCLGDVRRASQVLLEPESLCGNPPPSRETGQGVAGTPEGGSGSRGWPDDTDRMTFVKGRRAHNDADYETWRTDIVAPTLNAFENDGDARATVVVGTLSPGSHPGGFNGQDIGQLVVASPVTASAGHHGHSSPRGDGADNLVVARIDNAGANGCGILGDGTTHALGGATDVIVAGFSAGQGSKARGIGYANEQSPTLRAAESGTNMTPTILGPGATVRRLTPLECERLQGFPDGWTAGHSDSVRYRMLGNAVAVPVAEWVMRRLL